MRSITPQTLKLLQQERGTELILILGIQWVEDGLVQLYADQKIDGQDYPYPAIIEIGHLDTVQTVSSINDSQSVSVTLDDVDGKIKEILDNNNIHKQPVSVYFLFEGLSLDHKTLFFQGEINSPIVWDEGARTLSLTILSNNNSEEVGFSMEEGDFPSIPEEALGEAWPLVFGQVCNMPAVQVRSPRKGILLKGEGIHDFTIEPRLCQARHIQCPAESKGETTTIARGANNTYIEEDAMVWGPELGCVVRRFETICNLLGHEQQQREHEHDTINIRGGEFFPQDRIVVLNIDGALFRGTFSGTYFTITSREHPDYADWEHQPCHEIMDFSYGLKRIKGDRGSWQATGTEDAFKYVGEPITLEECEDQTTVSQEALGGPAESWEAYEEMESAGFHWCPAGSEVLLEEEAEILNIVSLLPGTVDSVAAYFTMPTGRRLLMEVPTDYYTVYNTDYLGYDVVEIGLEKELSKYDDNWDDQLYVSFTSDIGPNPVDIVEWLIDKYTDLTIDTDSFTAVKAALENYPCNFWLLERPSVLDLIQDIVYQSRCGIFIRNNIVFIKYLAVEPTSIRTLTEDDVLANTLKVKLTTSEDVRTKQVINWKKTGAGVQEKDKIDLSFVLKHNTERYGTSEDTHDYYTQNTYSTILKSATFWLIRDSNSWKLVEFDTPLTNLDLDIWDCVTINTDLFSSKCVITQIQYNWDTNSIHFEAWTPILAGETESYIWAWPANQNQLATFPEGDTTEFVATPPIDHLLRGGEGAVDYPLITGDRNPSDIDDVFPTVACETSDLIDLEEVYEELDYEIEALELARSNAKSQMNAAMAPATGGGGSGSKDKKPRRSCGSPTYGSGCIYEVTITYITPILVSTGGPCCGGGPCHSHGCGGHPCTGSITNFCHAYGALFTAYLQYMQALMELEALRGCSCSNYCVGQTAIYAVGKVKTIADPDPLPGEECEEVPPGDPSAPNQGEQFEPGTK